MCVISANGGPFASCTGPSAPMYWKAAPPEEYERRSEGARLGGAETVRRTEQTDPRSDMVRGAVFNA